MGGDALPVDMPYTTVSPSAAPVRPASTAFPPAASGTLPARVIDTPWGRLYAARSRDAQPLTKVGP